MLANLSCEFASLSRIHAVAFERVFPQRGLSRPSLGGVTTTPPLLLLKQDVPRPPKQA